MALSSWLILILKGYSYAKTDVAKPATSVALFAFAQIDAALHTDCGSEPIPGPPHGGADEGTKRSYAMRKSVVTVLAALAFSGIAAPAAAGDAAAPAETVSVAVEYGDLDLATPAGAAALDQRIDAAASKVCQKPDIRSVKQMAAWEDCKATAKTDAMEQLSVLEPYESLALASLF